jgi:hypothetical protein
MLRRPRPIGSPNTGPEEEDLLIDLVEEVGALRRPIR